MYAYELKIEMVNAVELRQPFSVSAGLCLYRLASAARHARKQLCLRRREMTLDRESDTTSSNVDSLVLF